jgi:putative endonuclease
MYFIYILQSAKDKSYYVGYTNNIDNRLYEHNFGRTRYTKLKRPWNLVYKEEYKTRKEAFKRERYLKKLKSKQYLENLIKNFAA